MEPKIRLKGFQGQWVETSWGKLSNDFKYGINAAAIPFDGKNKYLRITDIDDSTHEFSKDNLTTPDADLSECNDYIMRNGDIVVARTGATVGKTYIYHPKDGKVYFAGFLIRMRMNNVDSGFIYQNTLTNKYDKHIHLVSQRSGQPGVNVDELKSYTLYIPENISEQKAIGAYFQTLDSLIQSATKKMESLKQVKTASLQAMFPQEGETVPKVRFKGFEGEWETVRLGNIGFMAAGGTPSTFEATYWDGNINWLQSGAIQNNVITEQAVFRKITEAGLNHSSAYMIKKDSILIAITGATCANVGYLTFESSANQSVVSIEPTDKFNAMFIFQNLLLERDQILSFKGGSAQSGVSLSSLKKVALLVPKIEEQEMIGDFFSALDTQITLQSQRVEKLKQIKSACLDQMFV